MQAYKPIGGEIWLPGYYGKLLNSKVEEARSQQKNLSNEQLWMTNRAAYIPVISLNDQRTSRNDKDAVSVILLFFTVVVRKAVNASILGMLLGISDAGNAVLQHRRRDPFFRTT